MPPQCILIADDDPSVTSGLAMMLSRPDRTTVICSDVDAAEVALSRFPITHVLTDIQFTGNFGFEGLHFVNRIRSQRLGCRIIVMTGAASDELRREALRCGATAVLSKPFDLDELERALGGAVGQQEESRGAGVEYQTFTIPAIEDILMSADLTVAFQPIAQLSGGETSRFGFEALARVRGDWLVDGAGLLFQYAEKSGCLARLNLRTIQQAIEEVPALPDNASIFINVDPLVFDGGRLVPVLRAAGETIDLTRIVLEITERSAFPDEEVAAAVFHELRQLGVRFALDDHGSAYSHLSLIDRIQPSFIKVSHAFGTSFEQDSSKEKIIRHVVNLARDFGCETILEGIESGATAQAARRLGITLAQGYYFGRPRSVSYWRRSPERPPVLVIPPSDGVLLGELELPGGIS